ncbi:MAG: hypothetical protein ACLQU4_16460 [Limisphaerales bacterium]
MILDVGGDIFGGNSMGYTIFYSWQSDMHGACNRTFIGGALKAAADLLCLNATVVESPRIDSGMDGISGTPEVASIMFQKIRESGLFVGDVTLTGEAQRHDGKIRKVPNSNVSLEMGYAAGVLGWDRVICVMNEHFGKRSDLPFDVRNRRFPIAYSLAPDGEANGGAVAANLTKWLQVAISTADTCALQRADDALRSLDLKCLKIVAAYGHLPSFPEPTDVSPDAANKPLFPPSIPRLLDLRLLRSNIDIQQNLYAYHWTHLGKKVFDLVSRK